jgi:hypothetical protein
MRDVFRLQEFKICNGVGRGKNDDQQSDSSDDEDVGIALLCGQGPGDIRCPRGRDSLIEGG